MTWLAPWMLAGGFAAAAVAVALHLIAWDRPEPAPLPTARFVPDPRFVPAARRRQLADVLLLLLRVLTILLVAAAFARPVITPARRGSARIVVLDRSRAVADHQAALDSMRAWRRDGDALVVFDSTARVTTDDPAPEQRAVRGSLSAALVAAMRAGWASRAHPESSEIVLVTPLRAEEIDDATLAIRNVWPGAVRLVRVGGAGDIPHAASATAIDMRAAGDDPLAAAAALTGATHLTRARIVRAELTAADSAFSREGGVLVHWPLATGGVRDGALIGEHAVVVAAFTRTPDTLRGTAVLRWPDGAAAAVESPSGRGCVRTVRAGVPEGDAVLRPRFLALVRELAGPCGSVPRPLPAADSVARALTRLPAASSGAAPADVTTGLPLAPWLFAAALAGALGEMLMRRRR